MDVEALAVSKISSMVGWCPHLKAYISTNDKTPFTDGYIDLHNGLSLRKGDFVGRVQVQVKGRTFTAKKGTSPKYPIARTDLLAYQKASGVLYFVVSVHPESGRCTPFYKLLSPFAIEWLLSQVPADQSEISVPFKQLPDEPGSIESIVALAIKTQDQNLSMGVDPLLFKNVKSLTLHTASGLDLEVPLTLTPGSNDFALELTTTGGLSILLGGEVRILPPDYVKRRTDIRIRSGAINYDGATAQRIDKESIQFDLSAGLSLLFRHTLNQLSTDVSLTLESTLAGRLKSVEFYLALLDTQVIEFNGKPAPFEITRSNDEDVELRDHSKALRALADLFGHLSVDTRLIDLDQIDEAQMRQLKILHHGFVGDEEIVDGSAQISRVLQPVGPWNLMFMILPGSAPDRWRCVDPFSDKVRQQFRLSSAEPREKEPIPVTAYDIVEEEHLGTLLNMRLSAIVGAYEAIADFPSTYNLANQRTLALITAADRSDLQREELLQAAANLNEWLVEEQGDQPHHLVNRWQIMWRRGILSTQARNEIRAFKHKMARSRAENADQLELACALLLDDAEEAEHLLRNLPKARQEQMANWPIWKLRGPRWGSQVALEFVGLLTGVRPSRLSGELRLCTHGPHLRRALGEH